MSARPSAMCGNSRPTQIAGVVDSATKSRRSRRSSRISVSCGCTSNWSSGNCVRTAGTAFPKLGEELGGRYEERIPLQDTSKNHHRMGAQDVHGDPSAKLAAVICADDGILVLWKHEIQARFIFDEVVHPGKVFQRPFHVPDRARSRVALRLSGRQNLLDQGHHSFLVKMAIPEVSVLPPLYDELTAGLCRVGVNPSLPQPLQMVVNQARIEDVEGLLTLFNPVPNERQQNAVLLLWRMEECADVAFVTELLIRKMDWLFGGRHRIHLAQR